MHRAALLLAAPVLAAGLLAGCDLPGGSPAILGPDRVPNDSIDADLPVLSLPAAITGTLDAHDLVDAFRFANPTEIMSLTISCPPGASAAILIDGDNVSNCGDDSTSTSAVVGPQGRITAVVEQPMGGSSFVPYVLTAQLSPNTHP